MPTAHGQCFCGLFRFSVEGSFGDVRYCHCSQCRRKSGTAFTANARVRRDQWSLEGPAELITEFESRRGLYNAFCARCGSPLYARSDDDPDDIRVRLGGFDGPVDVTVTGHVWVSSKSDWYRIEDSIPQFNERYVERVAAGEDAMDGINPDPDEVREFAKTAPAGPVAMLNLMRLKPGIELESFLQQLAVKNAPFVDLVKGETIYAARGSHDFLGGDDWDLVILFRYSTFSDFVTIVCDEKWRETVGTYREESLQEARLILTIPFPSP